jgi:hypothetical protein
MLIGRRLELLSVTCSNTSDSLRDAGKMKSEKAYAPRGWWIGGPPVNRDLVSEITDHNLNREIETDVPGAIASGGAWLFSDRAPRLRKTQERV